MKQLSGRALLIGIAGLLVITTSSMYVALKVGALPWPTVFVTVLSMALLKKAKNSSLQEINVTHTIMSSGAMVAGGLAFTIPGLYILNPGMGISTSSLIAITVTGALLGTLFSSINRAPLIEQQKLSFPIGRAAYETLITGTDSKSNPVKLFSSMGASVVFTLCRDSFGLIPSALTISNVGIWLSPMAFAIGAMIDALSAYLWLGGAVIGLFITNTVVKQSIGIGIMLGTGVGVLTHAVNKIVTKKEDEVGFNRKVVPYTLIFCAIASVFLNFTTELTLVQAVLTVAGVGLTSLMSGILTGNSGVNPMEVFGILVMLAVSTLTKAGPVAMFSIAGITAVSCGLSGDVMNDLKSGSLAGTNPKSLIVGEAVGGVIGALLSVVSFIAIRKVFGEFGTSVLPAPQAAAVATMAGGFGDIKLIIAGAVIGLVLYSCKISAATLGLGIYLSNTISFAIGIGAVVKTILKKTTKTTENDINIVSSGLLGGEGITGVIIAIISMFRLS